MHVDRLSLRILQANILPMHAQQHIRLGLAYGMDAAGVRPSSLPTDKVAWTRPVTIQALAAFSIAYFHPTQTSVGWIGDGMQTPIGSCAAGKAQYRRVMDAKLRPGGGLGAQSVHQQRRQHPLQQRRSLAQAVQDRSVLQFQRRLGGPSRPAAQRESFHGIGEDNSQQLLPMLDMSPALDGLPRLGQFTQILREKLAQVLPIFID